MISPRRITLHRVPGLHAFRSTLVALLRALPLPDASDTFVLVPTRAAGEQLRRTVEEEALAGECRALVWPPIGSRRDLYEALAARAGLTGRILSPIEREVLLDAVARAALQGGIELPYQLRPGLIAEMVSLYDYVRRLGRSVDDFARNISSELERDQDTDRGAARLLQQTEFLVTAYGAYEGRLAALDRLDEHAVRRELCATQAASPMRRVIVSVPDRIADPDGLWPADCDLLARIPGLEQIDLLATESLLGAGYLHRLYAAFPDLAEVRAAHDHAPRPVLVVPAPAASGGESAVCFTHRDREEELVGVVRALKSRRAQGLTTPLHRTALVVQRPLPYLYLARGVFADAGIPFSAVDTLPLAAEPYAAAVDLVLDAVASEFSRATILALARSPHFDLAPAGASADEWRRVLPACDLALAEARYLGGLERLQTMAARWSDASAPATREERRRQIAAPALQRLVDVVLPLVPLATPRPLVEQIDRLLEWLRAFDAARSEGLSARLNRVRAAVQGALIALRDAYARHDPGATGDVAALSAAIRRWLGGQTFALTGGDPGLQIVDAQAARYGDFDEVHVLGLVDGDWPERARRNALYPPALLAMLEPAPGLVDPNTRERDTLQSARALFRDLLASSSMRVRLSTFLLEQDAVVEPSVLLDEIAVVNLATERARDAVRRVTWSEALALEPRCVPPLPEPMAAWAHLRTQPDTRPAERLCGDAGQWNLPRVSVSRLEMFLNCPFKFFAAHVLGLEEDPEDQAIQSPLERGRFLHDLWERFFAEWQRRGHGRIGGEDLEEARLLFAEMCDAALATLPPVEAALERHRLLGSAVSPGIAYRVFAMEASRPTPVLERLLEFPLEGDFEFRRKDGDARRVRIKGKTDRVDVLQGARLRVIDYKSKNTPDLKIALQLPIYARLASDSLQRSRGGAWMLDEAMYVSFEGHRAVVPLRPPRGETLEAVIADAEDRMLDALDRIAAGRFPPQPAKKSLCGPCGYRAVCRLEWKESTDTAAADAGETR